MYQPLSGTWFSPDRKAYVDSSNLYTFGGGDPVNGRDPRGDKCLFFFGGKNGCADMANAGEEARESE